MRIVIVSTFPPIECGIATYTMNLYSELIKEKNEVFVISQHGAGGQNVYPAYSPEDDNIAWKIFDLLSKLTPDIVHIQHEFGIFGSQHGIQVNELILRLRMSDMPVAVTLHTVRDPMPRDDKIILSNIVRESNLIIVHEYHQKEILTDLFGNHERIRVIPHGIRDTKTVIGARKMLGLEGKKTALLAGYIRPTKCFERIIKIWPDVAARNPDAVLIMAGKMRGIEWSDYYNMLMQMASQSSASDQILILRGQFPQHTFDTILSAADCMLLPYEAGAQSGILANAAAFGLPVVTSELLSFTEWNKSSSGGLTASSDQDYVNKICQILEDISLQQEMKKNIRAYIKPFLWHPVCLSHISSYEDIVRTPTEASRYFYAPEDPTMSS